MASMLSMPYESYDLWPINKVDEEDGSTKLYEWLKRIANTKARKTETDNP